MGDAGDDKPVTASVAMTTTPGSPASAGDVVREKVAMAIIFLLLAMTAVAIDVYAFMQGATSTLSQVWLTVNRRLWFLTYLLAALCGVLIRHVSVPGPPTGYRPPIEFFRTGLLWTAAFWLGMYATWLWLWQLPDVDWRGGR